MPARDDGPTEPGRAVQTPGHYVEHGCFIGPRTWSAPLDGPLPLCYTHVP
jgi:hypothetical protein